MNLAAFKNGLIVLLGCAIPLFCMGYRAPGPEVEGGSYRDPDELTQRLFPDPGVVLHTPGAAEGRWSTVAEVYAVLEELALQRDGVSVREVGESLLGSPIKALFYEVADPDALTVLIQARVHGNEPASTEGALELAIRLVRGELGEPGINVIILPVLNPEGAQRMSRRSATDIDPNRDYILHNSGSIRAVYRLMRDHDPELVVDMHEHRAYAWSYDLMAIGPNNPNIPWPIRDFTATEVMGAIREAFQAAGLRMGPYQLLEFADDGIQVRESATTFVSEKNALGLAGRVSVLTEGRGIGLGNQHFERRTLANYVAVRAVLETASRRQAEIRELVAAARKAIAGDTKEWVLRVDPVKLPSSHTLINAETNELEPVPTTYWERSNGTTAALLAVPQAYLIPAGEHALIERLRRFGLELTAVREPVTMTVETMTVAAFEQGSGILYGGELEREDGAFERLPVLRNHQIRIQTGRAARAIPAGSQIVRTDQPNALYLLTLEPGVLSGYAALSHWGAELPVGFELPVYRLPELPGSVQEGMDQDHDDDSAEHGNGGPLDNHERADVGGA